MKPPWGGGGTGSLRGSGFRFQIYRVRQRIGRFWNKCQKLMKLLKKFINTIIIYIEKHLYFTKLIQFLKITSARWRPSLIRHSSSRRWKLITSRNICCGIRAISRRMFCFSSSNVIGRSSQTEVAPQKNHMPTDRANVRAIESFRFERLKFKWWEKDVTLPT